jgi:hypothetical protein
VAELLTSTDLPEGFEHPAELIPVADLGPTDLEPWWIFDWELTRG